MIKRLLLLLLLLLLAVPSTTSAARTPAAGHLRMAINTNAAFPDFGLSARNNRYVVLHAWQTDRLSALKAADPGVRVLVYKNLSFATRTDGWTGPPSSGVSYTQALEHPDWFLRSPAGTPLTAQAYSWLYAMDVGSAEYQTAWADNVLAELAAAPWDGAFLDDTNLTMAYHMASIADVARYPTDEQYQSATESMLAAVGPRLTAAGKLALPNVGSWPGWPEVGDRWMNYVSGGLDEMFTKWWSNPREGYQSEPDWNDQLQSLKNNQDNDKIHLAISHSPNDDADAARYGWASLLLGADGNAAYALHGDYTTETWFPEYDYDIGNPTGPEYDQGHGVHRRDFERGMVLVNPTSQTRTASLGWRGSYSGSGLTRVRWYKTMAPHTGLILTRDP